MNIIYTNAWLDRFGHHYSNRWLNHFGQQINHRMFNRPSPWPFVWNPNLNTKCVRLRSGRIEINNWMAKLRPDLLTTMLTIGSGEFHCLLNPKCRFYSRKSKQFRRWLNRFGVPEHIDWPVKKPNYNIYYCHICDKFYLTKMLSTGSDPPANEKYLEYCPNCAKRYGAKKARQLAQNYRNFSMQEGWEFNGYFTSHRQVLKWCRYNISVPKKK